MGYWIFSVTNQEFEGRQFTADEVLQQRSEDKFWGLGERTPNRRSLAQDDRIVFYVGNPVKSFAGSASLATGMFKLSEEQQDDVSHGTEFYRPPYGVKLKDIHIWTQRIPVLHLLNRLEFVENKEFWGAYFQGGIRGISREDFDLITSSSNPSAVAGDSAKDWEDRAEFALESHLEEFLDRNWDGINFGSKLRKYETEGQSGRQFPAGPWSIDFLCIDEMTGDFVVIELKRGQTSDATVGQLLRYMSYVKSNLAKPSQTVRGLIIAKDIDDALRYAIQVVPDVRILIYRVDFKLDAPRMRT